MVEKRVKEFGQCPKEIDFCSWEVFPKKKAKNITVMHNAHAVGSKSVSDRIFQNDF